MSSPSKLGPSTAACLRILTRALMPKHPSHWPGPARVPRTPCRKSRGRERAGRSGLPQADGPNGTHPHPLVMPKHLLRARVEPRWPRHPSETEVSVELPTFTLATQAPLREVGSGHQPDAHSRAFPSGAVTLRSFSLVHSRLESLRVLAFPPLAHDRFARFRVSPPFIPRTSRSRRPQGLASMDESVASGRPESTLRPMLPWASCVLPAILSRPSGPAPPWGRVGPFGLRDAATRVARDGRHRSGSDSRSR
jgi:hypothetical protein